MHRMTLENLASDIHLSLYTSVYLIDTARYEGLSRIWKGALFLKYIVIMI